MHLSFHFTRLSEHAQFAIGVGNDLSNCFGVPESAYRSAKQWSVIRAAVASGRAPIMNWLCKKIYRFVQPTGQSNPFGSIYWFHTAYQPMNCISDFTERVSNSNMT